MNAEETRLEESPNRTKHWKHWGIYVSERAWGTGWTGLVAKLLPQNGE